jgi:hypothetical protein
MNKETLEKLQDLRFPQYVDDVLIPNPTLSELISACGRSFRYLILHTQHTKKLVKPWEAVPNKKLRPTKKAKNGETPEEAVAQLWIELVTKK